MKKCFLALVLLIIAAPAFASSIIHGPESFTVDRNTPYSVSVGAQQYEALRLSFMYNSTLLDKPTIDQDDTFEYGVIISGEEIVLGIVKGLTGSSTAEVAPVSIMIPVAANENEFIIFARVRANTNDDDVHITNLEVSGELAWDGIVNTPEAPFAKAHGLVTICHFDDTTELFYKENVNIASIIKGKGHGQHGDDIIPLFWYVESKSDDSGLYSGNDWNKTSKALYLNNCEEGE